MRRNILAIVLFSLIQHTVAQTDITLEELRQTGLRLVEITTENGEEPQGTVIESPWNPGTYNMNWANKVHCRIVISQGNDMLYDSNTYEKNVSGAVIRINGNTTALYSDPLNMPYKLKLEAGADLLSRGNDEVYAEKNWRLLKDAVSLNTIIGLKVSQLLGMEWTSAYVPCNVVINGNYRGCYLLMEPVSRDNKCRIKCDKLTGAIIERDPYWWKEDKYFSSTRYCDETNSMYRWTWKHPDEDDLTADMEQYVQQSINTLEESLQNGTYDQYIDITSWAKWVLGHDILGTRDSGGANMYFKKYDNTASSLWEMPCLWDFDSSYEVTPGGFSRLHTSTNAYFSTLFNSNNKIFTQEYVKQWNSVKDELVGQLTTFISNYATSEQGIALQAARDLYNKRWNTTYATVAQDVQQALQWLSNHINTFDQNVQQLDATSYITSQPIKEQQPIYYNLDGTKGSPRSGTIVIARDTNGGHTKKYINTK